MTFDHGARPEWRRTGCRHFPYAARQSGQWWVLRFNYGFPAHDMYTLFVDEVVVADLTGDPGHHAALLASVGSLGPHHRDSQELELDRATVVKVLGKIARYADYGSEHGDPCVCCSSR